MAAGVGGTRSPPGSMSRREGLSPGPQYDAAVPWDESLPLSGSLPYSLSNEGVNVRVSKALSAQYSLTLTFFG